jgi:hypothetical protein
MNTVIIPERRSSSNYFDYSYTRTLSNGIIEHYNKEYFNPDFTRKYDDLKEDFEDLEKEILLLLIDNILDCKY